MGNKPWENWGGQYDQPQQPQQTQQNSGMGIGSGIIGSVIGTGINMLTAGWQDKRQRKMMEAQQRNQEELMDKAQRQQLEMWHNTNYGAQVAELNKAGLNPGLMYGMGGGGGVTTGSSSGSAAGGQAASMPGMDIGTIAQLSLLKAQKENIEANTAKTQAETANQPKTGQEIDSRTANNILDGVVKKYTGYQAEQDWNMSDELYEHKYVANQNELLARQDVASIIHQLWESGKLMDKSLYEIEAIALGNARTRAETKNLEKTFDLIEKNITGQDLQNMMDEIDLEITKGMQNIGGKNAPEYIKMAMGLIMKLIDVGSKRRR